MEKSVHLRHCRIESKKRDSKESAISEMMQILLIYEWVVGGVTPSQAYIFGVTINRTINCSMIKNCSAIARRLPRVARLLSSKSSVTPFQYQDLFDLKTGEHDPSYEPTVYRKLTDKHVSTIDCGSMGKFLKVEPEGLRLLTAEAMKDISHLLRPSHLAQLSKILKDKEATDNDRFVAMELLKNANIASHMVLPGCQDTGTAIVIGKRGLGVITDGHDEEHLSHGVYDTYTSTNLR